MTENKVELNPHGFYSIAPMPSAQELEAYYRDKYFQNSETVSYSHAYEENELKFFANEANVSEYIYSKFNPAKNEQSSIIDVGSGEGYFSKYFFDKGWNVTTLDYSNFAISLHNPELLPTLVEGDIYKSLSQLITEKRSFNFINLKNVLEHVIDPIGLLEQLKSLMNTQSLLRIQIPNDYSKFQEFLLDQQMTTNTWLCAPDHLQYFNFQSIVKVVKNLGFTVESIMADFPIELFLLNNSSNYVQDRSKGKDAHRARILATNFIFDQGVENYINFFSASVDVNIGRQIIIYIKL